MASFDYTYVFDALSDTPRAVKCLGENIAAKAVPTCKVVIDDSQLLSLRQIPEEVADLINLAVAVYVADRLSIRKAQRSHRMQIHVVVPVYQTYVCEWDSDGVRDSIGEGLLGSARMQGAA